MGPLSGILFNTDENGAHLVSLIIIEVVSGILNTDNGVPLFEKGSLFKGLGSW